MPHDTQSARQSLFTQVEVTPGNCGAAAEGMDLPGDHTRLLREILAAQDRQNELLEELVSVVGSSQRQRNSELAQWKKANPGLSRNCRQATEALTAVQAEFLRSLTKEITQNADCLTEGEFFLNELLDRFGPRLAHLNGVLQVLSQLSSGSNVAATQS